MNAKDIETRLQQHFPDAKIRLGDMTGGGDHWQLLIESKAFAGMTLVEQHQQVYKALGEWMYKEIHALSLTTRVSE